ncbi:hypothetical protein D3C84_1246720 [compost metagenome]
MNIVNGAVRAYRTNDFVLPIAKLDNFSSDLRFQSLGCPDRDDPSAIEHCDFIGELVGFLHVLRG